MPVGPKTASTAGCRAAMRAEYGQERERSHRLRAVDEPGPAGRGDRGRARRRARRSAARAPTSSFVFCAGAHLAAPEATLEGVAEALDPPTLVGCGAGGVLGDGARDRGAAPRSRCGRRRSAAARPTRSTPRRSRRPTASASPASPTSRARARAVLLPDPYSFPTDAVLAELGAPLAGRADPRRPVERADRPTATPRCSSATASSAAARSACASTASRSCRASRRAPRRSAPS